MLTVQIWLGKQNLGHCGAGLVPVPPFTTAATSLSTSGIIVDHLATFEHLAPVLLVQCSLEHALLHEPLAHQPKHLIAHRLVDGMPLPVGDEAVVGHFVFI